MFFILFKGSRLVRKRKGCWDYCLLASVHLRYSGCQAHPAYLLTFCTSYAFFRIQIQIPQDPNPNPTQISSYIPLCPYDFFDVHFSLSLHCQLWISPKIIISQLSWGIQKLTVGTNINTTLSILMPLFLLIFQFYGIPHVLFFSFLQKWRYIYWITIEFMS